MIRCDIDLSSDHRTGDPASASFFDRARTQLIGGRTQGKLEGEPYNFTKQTCVRINDIEASRMKLDKLYQTMDVDEITYQLREYGTQSTDKLASQQTNYLYSIKIVRAENLLPLDNNGLSDPFVVLEIDSKPVTRTRTCYETLNPRWDQTFDIVLTEEEVFVLALVYDEDVIGANDECGSVWFKLAPSYFGDYQTHELKLKIHPQGTLYLRIDMEGEKDDIQYWFAKAFRTLKRAEDDNAGIIVAKVSKCFVKIKQVLIIKKKDGRVFPYRDES